MSVVVIGRVLLEGVSRGTREGKAGDVVVGCVLLEGVSKGELDAKAAESVVVGCVLLEDVSISYRDDPATRKTGNPPCPSTSHRNKTTSTAHSRCFLCGAVLGWLRLTTGDGLRAT